ncbi:MAG: DnaA/Hda family protein [Pseudomonadota bacterium]
MPEQLIFDLPFRTAMGRADFFESEANTAALRGMDAWAEWPHSKMLLIGPEGAGKTHLAHVWAEQTGARVIAARALTEADVPALVDAPALAVEDVDRIAGLTVAEASLFHIHNALGARNAPLLLTARTPPARWRLTLPDLTSRMMQADLVTLDPPDDALLAAVMVKLAQDRQLVMTPPLVNFTVLRMERSFAAVKALIEKLDALSLTEKKPPMKRHIRDILEGRA